MIHDSYSNESCPRFNRDLQHNGTHSCPIYMSRVTCVTSDFNESCLLSKRVMSCHDMTVQMTRSYGTWLIYIMTCLLTWHSTRTGNTLGLTAVLFTWIMSRTSWPISMSHVTHVTSDFNESCLLSKRVMSRIQQDLQHTGTHSCPSYMSHVTHVTFDFNGSCLLCKRVMSQIQRGLATHWDSQLSCSHESCHTYHLRFQWVVSRISHSISMSHVS